MEQHSRLKPVLTLCYKKAHARPSNGGKRVEKEWKKWDFTAV